MRIIVIGAGVGGMTAALRLAHAGHEVVILEQGPNVGGKLNEWCPSVPGIGTFRFDTGPHVLTMPWAIRELFDDLGERIEDHLVLERIDPICRYHFPDRTFFDAPADPNEAIRRVAERFPGDEAGFRGLLEYAHRVHDTTVEPFLRQDFGAAVRGIPSPKQWRQLFDFLALKPWRSIHDLSVRHVKHPRLQQIVDLYAFYNGSSPYLASAIFAIIAWVQWGEGTFYLHGGLRTYAEVLSRLCERKGIEIRCETPVERILISERTVTGCIASGVLHNADVVICNADPLTAYHRLIEADSCPPAFSPESLATVLPSTSAFVLLLGARGTPDRDFSHLAHFNSFLPESLDAELTAIFDRQVPGDDPVIGVTCQSVSDATAAPDGFTNLFVMTSPPALSPGFDWSQDNSRAYRDRIMELLETRCGMPGLSQQIVCEQVWTPQTFVDRYGAWRGSLYGAASNGLRSGFLRPPNRAKGIDGLYFVGGGTHPGGGLPLVTLSGKIVADAVQQDYPKHRKTKKMCPVL